MRNSIRVDLIAGLGLGDVDAILALVLQDVTGEVSISELFRPFPEEAWNVADNGYHLFQVAGAPAECNYPEGSIPRCASPTSDAGCPFECAPETPVLCDGVCVAADVDCPTAAFGRRSQTSARVCPKSWVACPVYGGTRTEWECVDVAGDLESCGGCATLLHQGVDCTALPGVNDVKVSLRWSTVHRDRIAQSILISASSALLANVRPPAVSVDSHWTGNPPVSPTPQSRLDHSACFRASL